MFQKDHPGFHVDIDCKRVNVEINETVGDL